MIVKNSSLSVDTEKLRKKILDLAMRGKLIPQDSQDEPASVLLEKIKEEKAQLIKEKKIKKSKPLPEITEEEKPFEIPESWEWVRLGEICNYIQRGRSPKYSKEDTGFKIISQKCIRWNDINLEYAKSITKDFFEKLENYRFIKKEDILWCSTGTGTVGRLNISKRDLKNIPVDSHVTLVRGNDNLNRKFLYYYLLSPIIQNNMDKLLTGTTKQKELGLLSVQKILIPLPPLAEQKRIVAKVEECMQAIKMIEDSSKEYEKLQNQLDKKVLDLAMRGKLVPQDNQDEPASVLLEKIKEEKAQLIKEKKIKKSKPLPEITDEEKLFEIPESWEWVRLGDVVKPQIKIKPNYKFKYVDIASIDNKRNYIKSPKIIDPSIDKIPSRANQLINSKDIVFSMVRPYLKNIAIVDEEFDNQIASSGFYILKLYKQLSPGYVFTILISDKFITTVTKFMKGDNSPSIRKGDLENSIIPLPPLAEQKRIVAKIEEIKQYLEI